MLQVSDFPAAAAAGPITALLDKIWGTFTVHCTPAGSLPRGAFSDRLRLTGAPADALAEDNLSDTPWLSGEVWAEARQAKKNAAKQRLGNRLSMHRPRIPK